MIVRVRALLVQGRRSLLILAFACIAACGGSGGGGSGNDTTSPPPPPATTPPSSNSLPGPRPEVGPQSYVNFETAQVRPLAISADGDRLYAVNTPDGRLEIFSITSGLAPLASVPVGIDPVAIAEDPQGRVWVVNHLSDSVSIVDVAQSPPRVIQTLWVGDEPRDIVFAGTERERAFITTAHRGQNSPVDPALNTPGIGRADVWVFNSKTACASTRGCYCPEIARPPSHQVVSTRATRSTAPTACPRRTPA
jgi:YVTN family beta-propeller protein